MKRILRPLCIALCLGAALGARAGTIEVSYDPEGVYADVGETPRERERNLAALAASLAALGAQLPAATPTLRVTLLDVDLAGRVRPARSTGQSIRIARGGADWPSIRLRYTLLDGSGQTLRSAEETLSDLNYTWNPGGAAGEPLRHEKRLLTGWFESRFRAPQ